MGVIKKIKQIFETQTTLLQKKAGIFKEEDVECAIDDQVVDCKEVDKQPYTGIPAPVVSATDDWFSSPDEFVEPVYTEKQRDYMEQETIIKMQEEMQNTEVTCESEDIHQKMYEIATKNWNTVVGGSENFQESSGGWMSGTGYGQFINDKK